MNLKKLKTKVAMIMLGTSLGITGTNANTINDDKKIEQSLEETKDFKVMANNTTKLNSKTVQKHNHKFKKINVIKTINKDKKTYTETQIKQCSCGKIIKIKTIKKCDFSSWKYNEKTKKDERVCKITGYKQTRKHKHNYSKLVKYNTNYEYKKCSCGKQKKFKHNLKKKKVKDGITYTCTNKKCDFTYKATMKNQKKINHKHIFSKLKKVTSKYEYWKCKVKGCLLRKKHNLKTIEINDQIILKCQNSNCTYKKVKHTHKYTLDKVDDQYEYWICKNDNKAKTITHNLINVKNQDGSVTVKCSNEGCNYNYLISHNHDYSKLAGVDDNYEYWECLNDGYQITVAHNIIKTVDKLGNTILSCSNPSCTYHKEIAHQHEYTKLVRTDDSYEYWACPLDNSEITKAHNMVESIDQNGDTLRKCSNPSCDYQKTIHNHQTNVLVKVDDNYEYWKCPKDDYQITKAHNIVKNIDKAGNTIITCSNEGCTYRKEIAHQHEYTTFVKYDNNYEYWACPYDQEQITKNHNLTSMENPNGSITYKCSTCDYEYTTHVHQYLTLSSYDDEYEHWTCECEEEELRSHNLVYDHFDLASFTENYRCTTCDYTKSVDHFNHEYQITRTDDNYEYLRCDVCKQDTSRLHSFPLIGDEDGCKVTYHCTNPGCGVAKETEQHFYKVTNTVRHNGLDPDRCYTDTYTCQNCGDSYDQDVPHSLQIKTENAFERVEMCKNCSYEKTTELIALDLSNDNKIMDIEEENNLNNSIVEDEIIIEEASLRMDKPLSLTRSLKR